MLNEGLWRHRDAIDPGALLKTQQMGTGVEPRAEPGSAKDRLEHGAGRALSVGAGNDNHGRRWPPKSQGLCDRGNALEAESDPSRIERFEALQPGLKCRLGRGREG